MNESQATIDGTTHPLPHPFFVIATQNPADYQGTYPLPEAQLDRFLLRIGIGYPDPEQELSILFAHQKETPLDRVQPVADVGQLIVMQDEVRKIVVSEEVGRYLLRLVTATRSHPDIELGVSPRGALAFFRAAQANALLRRRTYVSPEDVQAIAPPVLAHRVQLTPQARYGGLTTEAIVTGILTSVPVPT